MSKMIKIICFLAFVSTSNLAYAVNIATNSDITISFTEVIRNLNDSPITDANIDSLITLKQSNSSGADILFDAVVDSTKENITITPTSNLPLNQVVYVAIGASVEDEWDNAIMASSASFTTIDDRLSVTFDPADGTTGLPVNTNVIMTFSDAIRHLDDSLITSANPVATSELFSTESIET